MFLTIPLGVVIMGVILVLICFAFVGMTDDARANYWQKREEEDWEEERKEQKRWRKYHEDRGTWNPGGGSPSPRG